jgi:hypothetical protein
VVRKAHCSRAKDLSNVLDDLGEQFELVLVDTPPLLVLGDAMPLTSRVDAVVLVLHAGIRRPILQELSRQLQNSHAPILGFVPHGRFRRRHVRLVDYGRGVRAIAGARRAFERGAAGRRRQSALSKTGSSAASQGVSERHQRPTRIRRGRDRGMLDQSVHGALVRPAACDSKNCGLVKRGPWPALARKPVSNRAA